MESVSGGTFVKHPKRWLLVGVLHVSKHVYSIQYGCFSFCLYYICMTQGHFSQ